MVDEGIDPGWIRRAARDHGYNATDFERAYRLARLLFDIGRNPWLRDRLVLKGGTCINFFHDDLPRLSVDMDLNYVGSLDRDMMIVERVQVEDALLDLAKTRGYETDVERKNYILFKTRLLYKNHHGVRDSIRLDVNYLMRLPLYGVESRDLPAIFELDAAQVPALATEDVYGGKLKALASRAQARDLFDAARLFTGRARLDMQRLRAAFLFYGHTDDATLKLINLGNVASITDDDVERNLHPMLRSSVRPTAEDLKDAVLPNLEKMLERSESEIRYGLHLENGTHEPGLLFGDLPVSDKIQDHPAVHWRMRKPHAKLHGEEESE